MPTVRYPWCGDKGDVDNSGSITRYDASLIAEHLVGNITLTPAQQSRAQVTIISSTNDDIDRVIDSGNTTIIGQYAADTRMALPIYTGLQKEGYSPIYYCPNNSALTVTTNSERTLLAQTFDWNEVT